MPIAVCRRYFLYLPLLANISAFAGGDGYGALVGEWAPRGKCDSVRYAYTADGKYLWLARNERKAGWEVRYEGLYSTLSESELKQKKVNSRHAVIIADGNDQSGYLVRMDVVTQARLKGTWVADDMLSFNNPKNAKFNYGRCRQR